MDSPGPDDDSLYLYLSDLIPGSPSSYLDLPPTPQHQQQQPSPNDYHHSGGGAESPSSSAPEDLVLPYISRMLMEENIDDKFFYDYPDNAAKLLEAQQPFLDILSDPSSNSTSNATSDDTTNTNHGAASSPCSPSDGSVCTSAAPPATAPPAPKLKPAPTLHEAHPTPLPHPESEPASVLHAPESPPPPELKPAPMPHEAHPTPPPHPESAPPPVPTTKPEPRLSKLEEMGYGPKPDRLTLQHLKNITNNFSTERMLGRGGFGVVYKKQYEKEVNLIKLHHTNIVRLVGYCYETQRLLTPREGKFVIAWNTESLLCLEYLPNGSLHNYISDASSGHDWRTRWKIIEGICFGLTYLHEQSNGPIIHMDLKPTNILLDENMVPKIADFGLSRLLYKKHTISTATTSGTIGYMPPEYLQGIITAKSDIFSLGVIIMEVITGHRGYPLDITTSSVDFIELELQNWRNRLQGGPDYTSLEMCCQQIKRCIQIGLICVNPEWTKRPTMKQIINMLQGVESMNLYITNERSSSKVEAGWIELVIIEARDLIAADLRGTSDPYVRVHYGNNKKRTKVIIKTLNPQWNETFEFAETGEPLVLHVKDHNVVLPTASIGNCTVEYSMLSLNEPADKWIPLQGVRSGEIHVKIVRSVVDSKKKVA